MLEQIIALVWIIHCAFTLYLIYRLRGYEKKDMITTVALHTHMHLVEDMLKVVEVFDKALVDVKKETDRKDAYMPHAICIRIEKAMDEIKELGKTMGQCKENNEKQTAKT